MVQVVMSQPLPSTLVDHLRSLLGDGFAVLDMGGRPLHELLAALATADVMIGHTLTPEMGRHAPRLRLYQAQGAGTDWIDRAALPNGCYLANCYEHELAVAEYVVWSALGLVRNLAWAERTFRIHGDFSPSGNYGGPLQRELRGHALGIVGYGRIGRATARLAQALGMTTLAIKRQPDPELARQDGLTWLGGADGLDELLARSDIVVVSTPLTSETRGLIGASQLALMQPEAYLINIARGPVVDDEAFYMALRDRRLAGAAIDVWYTYPPNG